MKSVITVLGVVMASTAVSGILNTIGCPDCGNVVSVRAFMCPKCGCCREAIVQQVKAIDALSKLTKIEQTELSGAGSFGQVGRMMWLQEERIVRNVMTNEAAAVSSYAPPQRQAAKEASAKIKRILDLGFTMDHIFTMRHDLISIVIGKPNRTPLEY